MNILYKYISLISILIGFSLWGFGTYYQYFPSFFFPSFKILYNTLIQLFSKELFLYDILYSSVRVFCAFALSLLFSLVIASVITHSRLLEKVIRPYITFLRYIPVEATLPLIILFLGIGEQSKVGLLFFGTFIPLLSIILNELNNIPQEIKDLTEMLKYTHIKKLRRYFSFIGPNIYEHSRVILGWCRGYVVIAEMVATNHGIGYKIWEAQKYANIPKIYVAILILGIIGISTDILMRKFKFKLFPYLSNANT